MNHKHPLQRFIVLIVLALLMPACSTPATPKSSNADLSALTVTAGTLSPAFHPGTTAYSVSVSHEVTSFTVTGTKAEGNATLGGDNGLARDLAVGSNSFTITVTAQDGAVKNYGISVTRAGSNKANLSALTVSEGTLSPAFDAAVTAYVVTVPYATASITVTGTSEDKNATLSSNSGVVQDLKVGANIIALQVTAQDGTTTRDYVVTLTRDLPDTSLSALTTNTGTLVPAFSSGVTEYTLSVPYTTASLTITGTATDSKASVSSKNGQPQSLTVGSQVLSLVVTGADGVTNKTYNIQVTRDAISSNADLAGLYINVGSLNPSFKSDITTYTVSVPHSISQITVTGVTANIYAALEGESGVSKSLSIGSTPITFIVTAQNGIVKNYTVTVTRASALSSADLLGSWVTETGNTKYIVYFSSTQNSTILDHEAHRYRDGAFDSKYRNPIEVISNTFKYILGQYQLWDKVAGLWGDASTGREFPTEWSISGDFLYLKDIDTESLNYGSTMIYKRLTLGH